MEKAPVLLGFKYDLLIFLKAMNVSPDLIKFPVLKKQK